VFPFWFCDQYKAISRINGLNRSIPEFKFTFHHLVPTLLINYFLEFSLHNLSAWSLNQLLKTFVERLVLFWHKSKDFAYSKEDFVIYTLLCTDGRRVYTVLKYWIKTENIYPKNESRHSASAPRSR